MPAPTWSTDSEVRRRIEAALPSAAREALEDGLALAHVPRSRWLAIPSMRQTFGTFAVAALVAKHQAAGLSEVAAINTAAATLGIPSETCRGWLSRWRSTAWNG